MRRRLIHPEFFRHEILGELTIEARLLFIGLWCLADREGRLDNRPKRIKADLFPFDDILGDTLARLIHTLESHGFIHCYSVDGKGFIQIVNFKKWQKCHEREAESVIPEPVDSDQGEPRRHLGDTLDAPRAPVLVSVSVPVSVSDKHSFPSADGRVVGSAEEQLALLPPEPKRDVVGELFEQFWAMYPRKEARKDALKAFRANVKTPKIFKAVMAGLESQLPELLTRPRDKVKLAGGWIRDSRWEDEVAPPGPVPIAPAAPRASANPLVRLNEWGMEEDFWEGQYWFNYSTINGKKDGWLQTPEGLAWSRWEDWKETQTNPHYQPKPVAAGGPGDEIPYDEPEPEEEPEYALTDEDFEGGWQPPPPRSRAHERRGSMTSMADVAAAMMAKIGGAA
jgi:hypothetical protein